MYIGFCIPTACIYFNPKTHFWSKKAFQSSFPAINLKFYTCLVDGRPKSFMLGRLNSAKKIKIFERNVSKKLFGVENINIISSKIHSGSLKVLFFSYIGTRVVYKFGYLFTMKQHHIVYKQY